MSIEQPNTGIHLASTRRLVALVLSYTLLLASGCCPRGYCEQLLHEAFRELGQRRTGGGS